MPGTFDPPIPGYPSGALDIAPKRAVVVGDDAGDSVYVLDASTGTEVRAINFGPPTNQFAGSDPDSFAYNPAAGILYVTLLGSSAIAWVNLSSGTILHEIHPSGALPFGPSYDSANNLLYVTEGSNVVAINGTSANIAATLSVHNGLWSTFLDPLTNSLLVADRAASAIYVVNLTTFQVTSHFSTVVKGAGYGPGSFAYDSYTQKIYVLDGDGNVTVVDARTMVLNSSQPEVYIGSPSSYPTSIAVNPDRHEVYVAGCTPGGFRVCAFYDTNNTLVNYTLFNSWPGYVAYDPGTHHLLVYNYNDSVYLYNGTNDRMLAFVPMYRSYLGGVFDPDNGLDYIATAPACSIPGSVTIFDPAGRPSIQGEIRTGDGPSGVAYDSIDHRIFVTNYCSNSVTVIDATNNTVLRRDLPVGTSPYGIGWDPVNDTVFVANDGSQNVTVLNGSSLSIVATIALPFAYPYGVGVDPVDRTVFVTDDYSQGVTVLNATSNTVKVSKVTVGSNPQGVLYDPQNGHVYVANGGSNNVTVLNGSTGAVINTIDTSGGTVALALDPTDHLIFGADAGGSRIVMIDTSLDVGLTSSLPASMTPEGVVYVPTTHQVDVFSFGNGAINVLADAPQISKVVANPGVDEVGSPFIVSAAVANGTPPYRFAYSGLPSSCSSADAASLVCNPLVSGTFVVTVTVTDSVNYSWSASVNVTVVLRLTTGNLTVTPGAIDLGMSPMFNWSVQNGVAPYHYNYSGMPQGCGTLNRSWVVCTPTTTGMFTVVGTATDALGAQSMAATVIVVNPPPRVTSLMVLPGNVTINSTVVLETTWTGGTAPWTFAYSGLPDSCSSANASLLTCTPSTPGAFTMNVTMTDGLGHHSTDSALLVVHAAPPPPLPAPPRVGAFLATPPNVTVGGILTLAVAVSGGVAPFTYAFARLPSGCVEPLNDSTNEFDCRPMSAGIFDVQVNVTDALGRSAVGTTNVTVSPAPAPQSSGASEASLAEDALLGGVAGAVGGALVTWLVLKRQRRR